MVYWLNNKFEIGKLFIKQRMLGYAGNRLENICVKKALNNFKIILQQGLFKELLNLTPEGKSGLGLLLASKEHQIKKSKVVNIDEAFDEPRITTVDLPVDICRLLNNLDINWNNEKIIKANENNELDKAIAAYLTRPVQLINSQDDEAIRIKAAIKWCFDSYVVENQTLAFLQVCIGLEALLGDTDYNGALTETLADRCAYLLGGDIKGRKTIKENFKELYKVRSKLVHGNITELNSDQAYYLRWGKTILEYAIVTEIKHLNLGRL
ncbi:HEPN domain-containing protein [Methylomonas sp. SURF-1]|uniref:HEPN domain-containing protein n=1 Tax=Methylomonas aurea TaxID=2952224 RepID=A0ABT1UP30_9GAMM|nr:HEPN domain-containing protein [Methylomonas sp. SURF-1]MCQ8183469.1 HEPN domain-containing protein [Methylomonas sp. SURF-1]